MAQLPHYRKSRIPSSAKKVFEGVLFDVHQWDQELFDGTHATFEMVSRADSAVVFPVLPDGRILLIEDTQPNRAMEITAPAGRVEPGETPVEAAWRELLEETGYRPESMELLYTDAPVSKVDVVVHVYIGKNAEKIQEPEIESGELIIPKPVTFDQLIELACDLESPFSGPRFRLLALDAKTHPRKMDALRKKFSVA